MFEIQSNKIRALKLAPWWKRLIAYFIDMTFLYIVLIILVYGIYGKDFGDLINQTMSIGGINLLMELEDFKENMIKIQELPSFSQDMLYVLYIIRVKYNTSIFLLSQIISSIYFFIFWWISGQTFGASILKIKVISPIGFKPSFFAIILRVLGLKFIEFTYGLTAIIIFNPILKQRIHDSISQTVVIEEFSEEEEEELKKEKILEYRADIIPDIKDNPDEK